MSESSSRKKWMCSKSFLHLYIICIHTGRITQHTGTHSSRVNGSTITSEREWVCRGVCLCALATLNYVRACERLCIYTRIYVSFEWMSQCIRNVHWNVRSSVNQLLWKIRNDDVIVWYILFVSSFFSVSTFLFVRALSHRMDIHSVLYSLLLTWLLYSLPFLGRDVVFSIFFFFFACNVS